LTGPCGGGWDDADDGQNGNGRGNRFGNGWGAFVVDFFRGEGGLDWGGLFRGRGAFAGASFGLIIFKKRINEIVNIRCRGRWETTERESVRAELIELI
jgi:hypothetical protein